MQRVLHSTPSFHRRAVYEFSLQRLKPSLQLRTHQYFSLLGATSAVSQSRAWDTTCLALSSSSWSPRAGLSTMPCTAGGKPSTSFVLVSHCACRTPGNTTRRSITGGRSITSSPSNPSHSMCDRGCLAAHGAGQALHGPCFVLCAGV